MSTTLVLVKSSLNELLSQVIKTIFYEIDSYTSFEGIIKEDLLKSQDYLFSFNEIHIPCLLYVVAYE